jgi:hypothetical protein
VFACKPLFTERAEAFRKRLLRRHAHDTGIAQLVERRSPKPQVVGSSPAARAISRNGTQRDISPFLEMAFQNDISTAWPLKIGDPLAI